MNYIYVENNDESPKSKVSDYVRISKYRNIFARCYKSNWSKEVSLIIKIKNTVLWKYVTKDLTGENIIGKFYEKELQKLNQIEFKVQKVINLKDDKLYLTWKSYDNSLNTWIDKNISVYKMTHYPEVDNDSRNWMKVKMGFPNYATTSEVKKAGVDISDFTKKRVDWASLKANKDKSDIDKLKT